MAVQVGAKPPSVADCGREAFAVAQFFQGVENFRTAAQRFAERFCADGHNHKLLDVQAVVTCSPPLMTFIIGTGRDIDLRRPSSGKAAVLHLQQLRVLSL